MRRPKEMKHFVDDDVLKQVSGLLDQLGIQANVAGPVAAAAPLRLHAGNGSPVRCTGARLRLQLRLLAANPAQPGHRVGARHLQPSAGRRNQPDVPGNQPDVPGWRMRRQVVAAGLQLLRHVLRGQAGAENSTDCHGISGGKFLQVVENMGGDRKVAVQG